MYALDGAHAVPAAYLANRNALIACCFGFLSVLAFVRWRKLGHATTRWVSVLMLALALSAGEMGLATAAYLFSYALTVDRDGIRARLMRLLPHGGVLGAWALIYKLGNFGSHGSGFYLDPLHDPLGFAGSFCQRAAFLLMGQWSPIPAEMSMANAPGTSAFFHMSVFSFVVAAIVAVLFIPLVVRDRVARFWAPWCAAFVDTDWRRWSGESPVGFRRLGLDGTSRSTDASPFRRLFRSVGTPCLEGICVGGNSDPPSNSFDRGSVTRDCPDRLPGKRQLQDGACDGKCSK